jgi:hypothetical protein
MGGRVTSGSRPGWIRGAGWAAAIAVGVALGYSLLTRQIWEDHFIAFRFSENLCQGHGLVYNPGERVQGFSSPLGVLLPALCLLATGKGSYLPAFWLFRCISISAFATGAALVFRTMRRAHSEALLPAVFAVLFYSLDAKSVAFSVNGMETGFMLLFLAWGFYLSSAEDPGRWARRGVCWAGMMWTRPDGCIYIAALSAADLLFTSQSRSALVRSLLKSGVLCTALYGPWFAWAWWYYGSPVPQTIVAKSQYLTFGDSGYLGILVKTLPESLFRKVALIYAPAYYGIFAGWPEFIGVVSAALGTVACVYWLCPVRDPLGRRASFCCAVLCLYAWLLPSNFPWYWPPTTLCASLALVSAGAVLAKKWAAVPGVRRWVVATGLAAVAGAMAVLLGATAWQIKMQTELIEVKIRIPLGYWLRVRMRPGERVFLEPIGYIGYFSGAHVVDYPGLVSPEAVRLLVRKRLTMATLLPEIRPEWVVARDLEASEMSAVPEFRQDYELVKTFDVRPELFQGTKMPGWGYLLHDAAYFVFKRREAAGPAPRADARGGLAGLWQEDGGPRRR